jgi:DNA-binding response OmpR family regulator
VSVIGLSARTMSGDRDKAIEAGCDDYDIKPIEFDRLIGKIERPARTGQNPGALSEGRAGGHTVAPQSGKGKMTSVRPGWGHLA